MKDQTKDGIRLALVIPAALIGFYLTFFLSIGVHSMVNTWCPDIDSGGSTCPNWYSWIPMIFGAAVAPALVVLFSGLMAPVKRRPLIVWTIYALGLSFAVMIGSLMPGLVLLAASTGAITAGILQWKAKKQRHITIG